MTEDIIIALSKSRNKKIVPLSIIFRFAEYLRQYGVRPGINMDSIEYVMFRKDMIYELIGDNIFVKGVLPQISDGTLLYYAEAFKKEILHE